MLSDDLPRLARTIDEGSAQVVTMPHEMLGSIGEPARAASIATAERVVDGIVGRPLQERRSRVSAALARRDERLARLHAPQVALPREWQPLRQGDDPPADDLLIDLFVTVNAIASGLGTTG